MHVEAAASAAEVFARLSEDHREVLWLTHVTGHTTREVAGFLGIPEGTVKTRRFRALAHARIAARSVA
jgi:DNA-directed RNA polymerase specialized sigma24 family protein